MLENEKQITNVTKYLEWVKSLENLQVTLTDIKDIQKKYFEIHENILKSLKEKTQTVPTKSQFIKKVKEFFLDPNAQHPRIKSIKQIHDNYIEQISKNTQYITQENLKSFF